jgi:hypothetical protein
VIGTAALTALGISLIAVAGRDVFDALFHPEGKATLGRAVMRVVWRAFRAARGRSRPRRLLALAGPTALLLIIAGWAVLLALGWSLIYLPHLDGGFGPAGPGRTGFVDAVHIPLVTLTTAPRVLRCRRRR